MVNKHPCIVYPDLSQNGIIKNNMNTLYNIKFLTEGLDQKTQQMAMVWKHYKTVQTKTEVNQLRRVLMQQGYSVAVNTI